jgi:small subunit ribosomal protein S13
MAKKVEQKEKGTKESKMEKEEIKGIVHLFGRDIKGNLKLEAAFRQIKGVGLSLSKILANTVSSTLNVPVDTTIGKLSDEQLSKVEEIIKNPAEYGVPSWQLNRRKDVESGKDLHLVGSDLIFMTRQDIEREKTLYTWRGYRHAYGQPVRGQCTRTSGRKGLTVGVTRAKVKEATAAAKGEKKEGAKAEKK